MSREILFKGKRIFDGEWIEGNVLNIKGEENPRIATSCLIGEQGEPLIVAAYEIDPETLCQYTGLTDKNDKRIWENDILHRAHNQKDDCIVVWDDGGFRFKNIHAQYNQDPMTISSLCFTQKNMEKLMLAVAGNVFDNPELLE